MKKMKFVVFIIAAMILVLGITACDTGSSSDTDDDDASAIPTIDQLVGTWEWQTTETEAGYGVTTIIRTMTLTKTGSNSASFTRSDIEVTDYEDEADDNSTWYNEQEGRVTLDADGIMTMWIERERDEDAPLTSSDPWDEMTDDEYSSFQIIMLDSIVYYGPFERSTNGTGLFDTWSRSGEYHNPFYTEITRETLVITDSSMTGTSELSYDGVQYYTDDTYGPSSYTRSGNVFTSDLFGESATFTILQSGDWLVFGGTDITSTTSFGWVKQ